MEEGDIPIDFDASKQEAQGRLITRGEALKLDLSIDGCMGLREGAV